jgi:Na+-transporting NADH:ubiquinone oxidoreductase subunit D
VIATLVILVDQVLKAFTSTGQTAVDLCRLIITNCIVMGRAEGFAMSPTRRRSFFDGIGNGLGYAFILMTVSFFRELLGSGTVFGMRFCR